MKMIAKMASLYQMGIFQTMRYSMSWICILYFQILNEVLGHVDLRIHTGKAFIKTTSNLSYGMFDISTYMHGVNSSIGCQFCDFGQLHKHVLFLYKLSFVCFSFNKTCFLVECRLLLWPNFATWEIDLSFFLLVGITSLVLGSSLTLWDLTCWLLR